MKAIIIGNGKYKPAVHSVRLKQYRYGLIIMDNRITVIGSGSWGTALAIQMARTGTKVTLWGRDAELMSDMAATRENKRYLPGAAFPGSLSVEADWDKALDGVNCVLVSVPSHSFRGILERLKGHELSIAWATKGLELSTGMF